MAYRRTERIQARLAENRRRIIDAARTLVAEGGFRNAPIAAVAAAAGLATGTVYRYFPSKGDLFTEVFRVVVQREVDVVGEVADTRGPVTDRIETAVTTFAKRAMANPRLAFALLVEPIDPAIESERLRYRKSYASVFSRLIHEGIRAGELPAQDPNVTAACLVGALSEALAGPLAPDHEAVEGGAERVIAHIAQFCVRAVSTAEVCHETA